MDPPTTVMYGFMQYKTCRRCVCSTYSIFKIKTQFFNPAFKGFLGLTVYGHLPGTRTPLLLQGNPWRHRRYRRGPMELAMMASGSRKRKSCAGFTGRLNYIESIRAFPRHDKWDYIYIYSICMYIHLHWGSFRAQCRLYQDSMWALYIYIYTM